MKVLSDELLRETYVQAKDTGLDTSFVLLLENEMKRRGLSMSEPTQSSHNELRLNDGTKR